MQNVVDVILLAGEVLLTSGAEIHRVEETIERMGRAAGFVEVEVYATPTGLFISLYSAQGQVFSRVRRIRASVTSWRRSPVSMPESGLFQRSAEYR